MRVDCSSGTYIRALARDLGAALGVGGHLTALRRTRIGPFRSTRPARSTDRRRRVAHRARRRRGAAALPVVDLTAEQAVDLGHGKRVAIDAARGSATSDRTAPLAAIAPDDRLVAIVERRGDARSKVVTGLPAEEAARDRVVHLRAGRRRRRGRAARASCSASPGATRATSRIGALALVELLLIVQLVVAILAPASATSPPAACSSSGSTWSRPLLLPPAAAFWALLERSRWSTVILGVAALAVAVMVYRMLQIWTVQSA